MIGHFLPPLRPEQKGHLDIESQLFEGKPHLWIQWKGTTVCCDVICGCGAHLHFDGEFFYYFKCPCCDQAYECGTHASVYPVEGVPDGAEIGLHVLSDDDEETTL